MNRYDNLEDLSDKFVTGPATKKAAGKTYEYKGIFYAHVRRGKWVITSIDYLNFNAFNCEQDLKNYIDQKIASNN